MTTLNTIVHAATFIEEAATTVATAWATMQEVTFMAAIIYALNTVVHLAGKTYDAGKACGRFYFRHLHKHVKWLVIRLIALTILLAQLTWEGACIVYQNREEIAAWCVKTWHQLERAFIYESPKLA